MTDALRSQLTLRLVFPLRINFGPFDFPFDRLFFNPNLKEILFFRTGNNDFTDIPLGRGIKQVKYLILTNEPCPDFEIELSCIYIKTTTPPERYKQEDFDLLKSDPVIMELCQRCLNAEAIPQLWGNEYNLLIQEIEKKIQRRVFNTALPDDLIEFTNITSK